MPRTHFEGWRECKWLLLANFFSRATSALYVDTTLNHTFELRSAVPSRESDGALFMSTHRSRLLFSFPLFLRATYRILISEDTLHRLYSPDPQPHHSHVDVQSCNVRRCTTCSRSLTHTSKHVVLFYLGVAPTNQYNASAYGMFWWRFRTGNSTHINATLPPVVLGSF